MCGSQSLIQKLDMPGEFCPFPSFSCSPKGTVFRFFYSLFFNLKNGSKDVHTHACAFLLLWFFGKGPHPANTPARCFLTEPGGLATIACTAVPTITRSREGPHGVG